MKLLDNTLAIFLRFSEFVNGSNNLPLDKIPKKVTLLVLQVLTISGESLWTYENCLKLKELRELVIAVSQVSAILSSSKKIGSKIASKWENFNKFESLTKNYIYRYVGMSICLIKLFHYWKSIFSIIVYLFIKLFYIQITLL